MKNIYIVLLSLSLLTNCSDGVKEVEGTVRLGHEVRAFTDNKDQKEYWLLDKSGTLEKAYQEAIHSKIMNYQPVRAKLKVQPRKKSEDGFAAEYDGTYEIKQILTLTPIMKE